MIRKRDTSLSLPEYDIRDQFGIYCGYIAFLRMSKKEGNCFFRLKLYKDSYENEELLYEILRLITKSLIIEDSFYKVNFVCDININTRAITKLDILLRVYFMNHCYKTERESTSCYLELVKRNLRG